jgi:hypothetical protein
MGKRVLTPGHGDDGAPVLPLRDGVAGGITWGDVGYRGQQRVEEGAAEAEMLLRTRAEAAEQKFLLTQPQY